MSYKLKIIWIKSQIFSHIVPRYDEVPTDWENVLVITRVLFHCIFFSSVVILAGLNNIVCYHFPDRVLCRKGVRCIGLPVYCNVCIDYINPYTAVFVLTLIYISFQVKIDQNLNAKAIEMIENKFREPDLIMAWGQMKQLISSINLVVKTLRVKAKCAV